MKSVVKALAVTASLAMLIPLGACGSTPGGSSSSGSDATLWVFNDNNTKPVRDAIEQWNKDNPDKKISSETFANDAYKEKIRTAIGSGNAPTMIMSWGGASLKDYADQGSIVDLTGDLKDTVDKTVLDSVAEGGYVDGKLYGTSFNGVQPALLFFNKKVLKEAGVSKEPQTWDELLTAVNKVKATGKTPITLAGGSKWPYLMWAAYLVDRIGGPEVFQKIENGDKDAWSDPAVLEAMTKIQDLVKAGAFDNTYQSLTADDRKDVALLVNDTSAMEMQGSWAYPDFVALNKDFADNNLSFAAFPTVAGGKGDAKDLTGNLSNYFSISSKASETQQKNAIDFLKNNTYSDTMVSSMLETGSVPPVKNAADKVKKADTKSGFYSYIYEAASEAPSYQLSWDQALPSDQAEAVLNNLEQVFLLQITPQQFVDNMNKTLK
ncbi:extracellular solute-binding protein [Bifidobacterium sp. 82T24]|uniref:extracellular solute-binding protein n=1 Tax=Bifidobacterium pluvialisilvae TaxID=2834436 RepID=UPI001C56898C|nr:extracellular solute-binding protein [Bifidobacterium pluvialisilvae]MBW3087277.1 extracellular solute-binding protein [Bifidobacterium pluvialisilvae]